VQDFDQTNIVFDRAGVLKAEKDRRAPGFAGTLHVACPFAVKYQVGELFEPAVPLFDVLHRFAEILMVGDGDMHRIHSALPHLAEYLFRPVGVLQAIYSIHARYSGVPDDLRAVFTRVMGAHISPRLTRMSLVVLRNTARDIC